MGGGKGRGELYINNFFFFVLFSFFFFVGEREGEGSKSVRQNVSKKS